MPLARATGIGSTLDCADHSYSVCLRQRSTISCPVIAGLATVVVIAKLPVSKIPNRVRESSRFEFDLVKNNAIEHGRNSLSRAFLGRTAEGGCPHMMSGYSHQLGGGAFLVADRSQGGFQDT